MARTDTLTHFLTDVASAIKTKKGSETPILASNFDTEIANLPSGGQSNIEYEIGTFTLSNASQAPTINFSNTHTELPMYVLVCHADSDYFVQNDCVGIFEYAYIKDLVNCGLYISDGSGGTKNIQYGRVNQYYKQASGSSFSNGNITINKEKGSSDTKTKYYPEYWVSTTSFTPHFDVGSGSTAPTAVFDADTPYNWIAIWKGEPINIPQVDITVEVIDVDGVEITHENMQFVEFTYDGWAKDVEFSSDPMVATIINNKTYSIGAYATKFDEELQTDVFAEGHIENVSITGPRTIQIHLGEWSE